jgi:hypothetical protein
MVTADLTTPHSSGPASLAVSSSMRLNTLRRAQAAAATGVESCM